MFSYDKVKNNPKLLLAMTSLTRAEFEQLLVPFQAAWEARVAQTAVPEQSRQCRAGAGRKPALRTVADKLLFILYYFKAYPLQEILAFEFGMSQGEACSWIATLSPVLKQALRTLGQLPERDPTQLATKLAEEEETTLGIDGTERRVQRPKDQEKQRTYYSGKKKAHTVKNNVVVGLESRRVRYLSQTYEGKKHDKKICDEEQLTFPPGISLYKDTGFQGYEPAGVRTYQPKKKPRGQELSAEDRERNRLISKVRIIAEHVISGIKRCHILKDVVRNTRAGFVDLVMVITCGLHNFRTQCRSTKAAVA
jgi:DDE superfamily endonuclease/Helix-turn-helix of DDE superfamily endonuclease